MTVQILGLFYDAVGIVILAWPAVNRGAAEQIAKQCGTHRGENTALIAAFTRDRIDTATGSFLLGPNSTSPGPATRPSTGAPQSGAATLAVTTRY